MHRARVIPILLLKEEGLVKGQQFKNHQYIGDPINVVKIFNEKEVDELVFFDISATMLKRDPDYNLIAEIAGEAFMPIAYGGGIKKMSQIEKIYALGIEKVVINSEAFYNPKLITEASKSAGSQSIVVSLDIKKSFFGGYEVYVNNGKVNTNQDPVSYAKKIQDLGAGELIVCSIDREGTQKGYDLKLVDMISSEVDIPVIASGGAGILQDFADIINNTSASAVAAGSMFTFYGKHRAVLITYPKYSELETLLKSFN